MNVEVKLEWRECEKCGAKFKVMTTSKQKSCSISCRDWNTGALQRVSKGEKFEHESVIVNVPRMQPTENAKIYDAALGVWPKRIERNNDYDLRKDIGQTETPKSLESEIGVGEQKSMLTTTEEATTKRTSNGSESKSIQDDEPETSLTDSGNQSKNAELVSSHSMNLLDDTAMHLHGLMKGLHSDQPEPTVKLYDPERVSAACNCAKQIYSLMRLKLDAIKLQQESK